MWWLRFISICSAHGTFARLHSNGAGNMTVLERVCSCLVSIAAQTGYLAGCIATDSCPLGLMGGSVRAFGTGDSNRQLYALCLMPSWPFINGERKGIILHPALYQW